MNRIFAHDFLSLVNFDPGSYRNGLKIHHMHSDEETLYTLDTKMYSCPQERCLAADMYASVKAEAQCCATTETSELEVSFNRTAYF